MEPLMSPTNGPRSFPAKPVDPPVGQTVVPAGSQQGSLSKAQARSLSKALAAYLAGPPRRSQR
jgi:hypothetical protein